MKEGLQLRSNTAQLIKIAFDDDVHDQEVENFRRSLVGIRYPEHISQVFAFKSGAADITAAMAAAGIKARKKSSSKNKTIRGFANKTIKTVSRAAHFGTDGKNNSRRENDKNTTFEKKKVNSELHWHLCV